MTPCCWHRPSSKRTKSSALETPVTTSIWPPTSDSYAMMMLPRRKVLLSMMRRLPQTVSTLPLSRICSISQKKVSLHITKAKFAHYHLHSPFYHPFSAESFEHFRTSRVKLVVLLYQKIMIHALCKKKDHDTWTYIWGNGTYSSGKAYKHLKGSQGYSSDF
jgi:hypothetical protein